MFIDVHAHAYRPGMPPADGHTTFATPDEVLRRYDELQIEKGLLPEDAFRKIAKGNAVRLLNV